MQSKVELRVCELITGLRVGGAERVVLDLAVNLNAKGIPVSVISLDSDCSILDQYDEFLFPIKSLGVSRTVIGFFNGVIKLNKELRKKKITVIHAHMFHSLLVAVAAKLLRPSIKIVFTSHNASGFSVVRRLMIQATKPFRSSDIVFGIGQHPHLNVDNTFIVKNSVNVPQNPAWRPVVRHEGEFKFLFLGRFKSAKNPVEMVRLFSKMTNKNCRLLFAGDGDLRKCVVDTVLAEEMEDRIDLLGEVPDVPSLLGSVDCLVMPSLWEGLPLAILEAGAQALPVLATPVGSVPELLSDGCGYLAKIEDFSQKMDEIVNDYASSVKCGERLFSRVKAEYNTELMVEKHVTIYSHAIRT